MKDIMIIGSGPAGLSAAIYAKRAGLDAVVLEKAPMSGGQVLTTYEVDNYPGLPGIGGFELGMKFREHADRMQVEFIEEEVEQIEDAGDYKKVITTQGEHEARTVLLATGAVHAKLGIPGEDELAGMGVSYCATCDGAFFRKKTTAVIGGGDVAVEDAIFLSRMCEKVYLIHRRDELRAAKSLQKELFELPNVEVLWNSLPEAILGSEQVEGLRITERETGKTQELNVSGVFVAVGILPNTDYCSGLVEMDEKGYVLAGEDCCTSRKGIYAAGDIRKKPLRQILTAAADGANAITSIQGYLAERK